MALTSNSYTGNGSTVLFSFTFPYLDTADIKVSLNGVVTTAYTLANATTIQFNTAPANGVAIKVYRATNDSQAVAEFYPGSAIRSTDLNKNFTQNLYVTQEANNASASAVTTAAGAVTTANTATTNAASAVNTANTASTNASAAVTTANTASTNASAAVSTANTASSNASTAVTTANSAVTTANTKGDAAIASAATANTTAASAVTTANAATSTANTASTNAASAVSTANTASSNASAAVSTANTASANAATAVTTANNAVSTANASTTTANSANSKADQAIAAVANSINFTLVANVAAIPATPANNTYLEVGNSTGIQAFTPLAGVPAGFVGDPGLTVRIVYNGNSATWNWLNYFANNSETRYLKLAGGTLTGGLTLAGAPSSGLQATTKTYVDAADATLTTAASAAQTTANTGVTNAAAAQSTANAAVVRAGDTMTGALGVTAGTAGSPSIFISGDTNTGIYSPGADQVAISTGGSGRLFVDATGRVGINTSSPATISTRVLHISGSSGESCALRLSGNGGTGIDFIQASNGDGYIYQRDNNPLIFGTNATERLRITEAGLVGIGTSSPAQTFHVVGRSQFQPATGTSVITLVNTSGGDGSIQVSGGATSMNYGFNTYSTSNALYIQNDGKVGIGTTGPGQLLEIHGASNPAALVKNTTSNVQAYFYASSTAGIFGTPTVHPLVFNVENLEKARIDTSGRLLVGTSTSDAQRTASMQIASAGGLSGWGSSACLSEFGTSYNPWIALQRSRNGTVGSHTVVSNGDVLGGIQFNGSDGDSFESGASIKAEVDGTPGANDMPGRLVFSTTADGAASPTERFRIGSAGQLGIGGATYGTAGQVLTSGGASAAPTWSTSSGTPAGAVDYFAMSSAPTGYLKANGAAISRSTYSTLFTAIGTTFGTGDGSTTFNVPDLRGEFVRGWADGRAVDTGRALGSAQADDFKSHTHGYVNNGTGYDNDNNQGGNRYGAYGNALNTSATGGTETRPRNIALLACIKF